MDIKFTEIASRVCESVKSAIPPEPCKDQYVGILGETFGAKEFDRKKVEERPANVKCLILILESPHKDEYKVRDKPVPANGSTGINIRNKQKWEKAFGSDYDNYGLILMNAVQYQCSLGLPTECVRNQIFTELWDQPEVQEHFRRRLKEYVLEKDVVVNCCTKGDGLKKGKMLRDLVQKEIEELKNELEVSAILKRTHPSSWRKLDAIKNEDWK